MEDIDNFIFDEAKITKNKHFALGVFKGHHYIGVMIPKEVKITDKKTKETTTQQIIVPVIVLSNHNFYEITERFQKEHNVKFSERLLMEGNRWNLKEMEDFYLHRGVKDAYKETDFQELFERIRNQYKKYVYLEDGYYDLHAIWDIGTYFFHCFETYPYIELNGLKGTGKTKVMRISEKMAFNGKLFISPTPATVFRFVERNKPTLYIDEAEKLFKSYGQKEDNSDLVELLNAGYTKAGRVPRLEKNDRGKWDMKSFDVYCPKMLASINGMKGALKDRCITEIMVKPSKKDGRGDIEPSNNDNEFFKIRNKLYPFALKKASAITFQYQNLRKDFELSNRNWQLWKPILSIAKLVSEEVYQRLGKLAEEIALIKEDVLEEDTWPHKIIIAFQELFEHENTHRITVGNIKAKIIPPEGERKPSNTYIGKYLNRIGLSRYRKRIASGVYYELRKKDFEKLLSIQEIVTQATQVTQVTPNIPEETIV